LLFQIACSHFMFFHFALLLPNPFLVFLPCCMFCPLHFALLRPIQSFTFCLVDFVPCISLCCYMFLRFYFTLLLPTPSQFALLFSCSFFCTSSCYYVFLPLRFALILPIPPLRFTNYYKNKLFWLENLIKKDPIWTCIKKTILSIWTSRFTLVFPKW
jgi:hypothetical protein